MQKFVFYLILVFTIALAYSCVSYKELVNFNEGPAFPPTPEAIAGIPEIRIQPDDILAIQVSLQFELSQTDRTPFPGQAGSNIASANDGYLVDKNGYIDFPIIGKVKLGGLTTADAKKQIALSLQQYYKDPIVNIRFVNFKFTVFGEVAAPGTYTIPEEQITILEAIGTARDLTTYANRTNILIIREQDGNREFGYINLRSRELFKSPYFYLRPNDVIYVEPLKEKVNTVQDRVNRVLPWVGLGTTLINLIIIITRN
jgi:polysaccharide export outer membrane protein